MSIIKLVKATSTFNMLKNYKTMGYTAGDARYLCPECLKKVPNTVKSETLIDRAARHVVVFTKEDRPAVAACRCGFRKVNRDASDKPTGEDMVHDHCRGLTKKNSPCKNNALENGFCKVHQAQAPCYEGKGLATQHLQEKRF